MEWTRLWDIVVWVGYFAISGNIKGSFEYMELLYMNLSKNSGLLLIRNLY